MYLTRDKIEDHANITYLCGAISTSGAYEQNYWQLMAFDSIEYLKVLPNATRSFAVILLFPFISEPAYPCVVDAIRALATG
jgi:hypothetical protein